MRRIYPLMTMVQFACDDKETEKLLRKLYKQVTRNGGIVHDKITIGCKDGDLKLTIDPSVEARQQILVLPVECLLPVDKFKLGLKGNKIIIKSHDDDLPKAQVEMMETMMALYNATGKIAGQKKTVTMGLYYKDKALLDALEKVRDTGTFPYADQIEKLSVQKLALDSFIKSRVLGFKQAVIEEAKNSKTGQPGAKFVRNKVIMPIIDFLNHHPQAIGFLTQFAGASAPGTELAPEEQYNEDGIAVVKLCPVAGSNECYVQYGPYDAVDALINYNYADRESTFVRSMPVRVKLPDGAGTLVICSSASATLLDKEKLPEGVQDLRFFIPPIAADTNKKIVRLRHLFVPQERAPRALRRVLGLAINMMGGNHSPAKVMDLVIYAEKKIIQENYKYYQKLSKLAEKHEPSAAMEMVVRNVRDVAKIQIENIERYPFFGDAMAKDIAAKPKKGTKLITEFLLLLALSYRKSF